MLLFNDKSTYLKHQIMSNLQANATVNDFNEVTVLQETENAYLRKPHFYYDEITGEWSFTLLGQKVIIEEGYYDHEDAQEAIEGDFLEPRNVHGDLTFYNGKWYFDIKNVD